MDWIRGRVVSLGFPGVTTLVVYWLTRQLAGIDALIAQGAVWQLAWLVVSGYLGLALWYVLQAGLGMGIYYRQSD